MRTYNKESLIAINQSYDHQHGVTNKDVERVNLFIEKIESSRSRTTPKDGDKLHLTTRQGEYFSEAHIEKNREGFSEVCENPFVPFVHNEDDGVLCSASGGAWRSLESHKLKYVGHEDKTFTFFGSCGACANGTVRFKAKVSVWAYEEPDPLYGEFTTEHFRKFYVSKTEESNRESPNDHLYILRESLESKGHLCMTFRTNEQYNAFIEKHNATVFANYTCDRYTSFVVWLKSSDLY